MTKRTWMIEKRESLCLSREQAAEKCNPRNRQTGEYLHPGQVSDKLIEMLEEDDRGDFEEAIAEHICDCEQYRSMSDKEFVAVVQRMAAEYDGYWEKVIAIYASN